MKVPEIWADIGVSVMGSMAITFASGGLEFTFYACTILQAHFARKPIEQPIGERPARPPGAEDAGMMLGPPHIDGLW
jgi:hypothetical protein